MLVSLRLVILGWVRDASAHFLLCLNPDCSFKLDALAGLLDAMGVGEIAC
jgi:hypothetical protein